MSNTRSQQLYKVLRFEKDFVRNVSGNISLTWREYIFTFCKKFVVPS